MTRVRRAGLRRGAIVLGPLVLLCSAALAVDPRTLLQDLDDYPHARQVDSASEEVIDHEIGLGAMQKIRGVWRFKHSERYSGTLLRYTWQIVDGFSSMEIMHDLVAQLERRDDSRLLFSCAGRACGPGAQWANRVFKQRVLYGVEDKQRYRVYALRADADYLMVLYSSARTADRQYFHVDLLRVAG
ncbi:MAG: DUF4892 domain-containing protein [Halioglobus sp.]|nr:DUF4892 domain-containing protein [Halioglobus sp.]